MISMYSSSPWTSMIVCQALSYHTARRLLYPAPKQGLAFLFSLFVFF
uniref:Uncharacterized protein n=1 Tax=Anguilla anguilla TaxID=7936 RepID=A0A0E9SZ05_ANGAN